MPPTKTATKPSLEVELLTPEMARALLAMNAHNRNMRPARVSQLADALKRGEWVLNGETIKLAEDGTLIDGQHRLQAVVDSGIAIESLVMRDLPMEVQDTVDTGRRRRLADILAIEGEKDSHALGAALSMLYRFREGLGIDYSHATAPSPQQALELLDKEPGIRDSVRKARSVTKHVRGPIGIFSALHYLFMEVDPEAATDFFDRLADGVNLAEDDPVLHLRNQLLRPKKERTFGHSPRTLAALMIKAFNHKRAGRSVELLAFKKTEVFPVIAGIDGQGVLDASAA
ncbi:MAG TPA: hypothetical protein VFJ57_00585 [Solirubrobacterales bacterium]|nr:hypothetical protein [Solirubrobacterales bacterium]